MTKQQQHTRKHDWQSVHNNMITVRYRNNVRINVSNLENIHMYIFICYIIMDQFWKSKFLSLPPFIGHYNTIQHIRVYTKDSETVRRCRHNPWPTIISIHPTSIKWTIKTVSILQHNKLFGKMPFFPVLLHCIIKWFEVLCDHSLTARRIRWLMKC